MTYVAWYFFIGLYFAAALIVHRRGDSKLDSFFAGFFFWPSFVALAIVKTANP